MAIFEDTVIDLPLRAVDMSHSSQPFFTVGVTTYNRRELLRQTLNSILAQTFNDFEVIVGNDYTDEVLSGDLLGILDPRIRFVNHPHNLREVGNANVLLSMALGRYFTWLSDDDLYEPDFFKTAHDLLVKNGFPSAFFSSHRTCWGTEAPRHEMVPQISPVELSGRAFLSRYFAGHVKIISVYGLFDTHLLRTVIGGVEELCVSGVGLYGEYIFLVRCAMFERIIYIDAPLVIGRNHTGSWGVTNVELDKYSMAGPELVRKSADVLRHPTLSCDLTKNLLSICDMHLRTYTRKLSSINESHRNIGAGTICGSMLITLLAEIARMRRAFIESGGFYGLRTIRVFAWFYCKYSLRIVKFNVGNWLIRTLKLVGIHRTVRSLYHRIKTHRWPRKI